MAGITLSGYNGLNTSSIIQALMQAERTPLTQLERRESSYRTEISGLGKLKSSLDSLDDTLSGLKSGRSFDKLGASQPDDNSFAISVGTGADPGSYGVEVLALAKGGSTQSENFSSAGALLGSGTLVLETGTYAPGSYNLKKTDSVSIEATDSLEAIRDKVNASESGVKASVVTDAKGSRLVFSSASGTSNGIRIQVVDGDGDSSDTNGLSRLAYDRNGTVNLTENRQESNAQVKVNGATLESESNVFENIVAGTTITAKKVSQGEQTVSVTKGESVAGDVQKLVDTYNSAKSSLKSLTAKDGALANSSFGRNLNNSLSSALRGASASDVNGLYEVGISLNKDGSLSFDAAKFEASIKAGKDVRGFIGSLAASLDTVTSNAVESSGSIPTRETMLQKSISDIGKQKDAVEARLARVQASYEQRFANLQTLLNQQNANAGSIPKVNLFA